MKTIRILLFLLCLFGLRLLALQAPPASLLGDSSSLHAQTAPIQSKKRPTATKRSNTWICFVTAGVVGIVVFFIGKIDQQQQEAAEEQREKAKSEKKKGEESETKAESEEDQGKAKEPEQQSEEESGEPDEAEKDDSDS
jgi:hypothetical protein